MASLLKKVLGRKRKRIMLIGLPGSGKTAFMLALFYDLIMNSKKYGVRVKIGISGKEMTLKKMIDKIREGEAPRKTLIDTLNSLDLEVIINGKKVTFRLEDWSGEMTNPFIGKTFNMEDVEKNPASRKFINDLLESKVLLIFYDPTQAEDGEAMLEQSRGLNRTVIYIRDRRQGFLMGDRLNICAALIIPKCDLKPELFNIETAKKWISEKDFILPFLKRYFKNFEIFPISAYGKAKKKGEQWIPESGILEAKNIDKVFKWILECLSKN